VCRCANALKAKGMRKGDRVVIYMPMIPEAVIAMQACARIGAMHSVVFGGFSANARQGPHRGCRREAGDHRRRRLARRPASVLKAPWTGARRRLRHGEKRHRVRRTGGPAMRAGRDVWWQDAVGAGAPASRNGSTPSIRCSCSTPRARPASPRASSIRAPAICSAKTSNGWTFDLRDSDVFWCTADVGWVTGHSYVAYGPLAAGATLVMYEGAPTFPDGGRFWKICQAHGVTIFYTAPTAIRALMKLGDEPPARTTCRKLRLLGSVGEPINPEAWMWYHRVIGGGRCPIVDTWWQTETGAIMMTPLPGVTPTKPGSCTKPLPGIARRHRR
jgi:acetyl-CoA synthetase